ncbi:hypothetical protein OG21DRAFT_523854 [Imleria badia]|nr:hypothetical protein OG21DRAFT_523854 [Imleria badia]
MYQMGIGAHPDQIQPLPKLPVFLEDQLVQRAVRALGLTPMTYSPDAILGRHRNISPIFMVLSKLSSNMVIFPLRNCKTLFWKSALGTGTPKRIVSVPSESLVSVKTISYCLKRAWRDPKDGAQRLRDANDAFRIVAESRGSASLRRSWEDFSRDSIEDTEMHDEQAEWVVDFKQRHAESHIVSQSHCPTRDSHQAKQGIHGKGVMGGRFR